METQENVTKQEEHPHGIWETTKDTVSHVTEAVTHLFTGETTQTKGADETKENEAGTSESQFVKRYDHFIHLVNSFQNAMFVTTNMAGQLHSRPMFIAYFDQEDGNMWFISRKSDGKLDEIKEDSQCNVTLQSGDCWISLTGTATVVRDTEKVEKLLQRSQHIFPGSLDENKDCVGIKVKTLWGEFWDHTGIMQKTKNLFDMTKAALLGQRVNCLEMGQHDKIDLMHSRSQHASLHPLDEQQPVKEHGEASSSATKGAEESSSAKKSEKEQKCPHMEKQKDKDYSEASSKSFQEKDKPKAMDVDKPKKNKDSDAIVDTTGLSQQTMSSQQYLNEPVLSEGNIEKKKGKAKDPNESIPLDKMM